MGKTADATPKRDAADKELPQYQSVHKSLRPSLGNVIPMMKWLLTTLGAIIMMTTAGCAGMNNDEFRVPGNPNVNYYGIDFYIDWNVFDVGNWSYQEEGERLQRPLPFGHPSDGYKLFGILTLDFKLKDGREYHEQIDLRPLIAEMLKTNTITDLSKTEWGGRVVVRINVKPESLSVVYVVAELEKIEDIRQAFTKYHKFPIYQKALN